MTEGIVLYSSHAITSEELTEVLFEAGGVRSIDGYSFGRLFQGEKHVWLWPYDEFATDAEKFQDEAELEYWELVRTQLGAEPLTCIAMQISSTPGSGRLAVHLAFHFVQHWPCIVVIDEHKDGKFTQKAFVKEDILQLEKEGGGFITYGM